MDYWAYPDTAQAAEGAQDAPQAAQDGKQEV